MTALVVCGSLTLVVLIVGAIYLLDRLIARHEADLEVERNRYEAAEVRWSQERERMQSAFKLERDELVQRIVSPEQGIIDAAVRQAVPEESRVSLPRLEITEDDEIEGRAAKIREYDNELARRGIDPTTGEDLRG